MTEKLEGKCGNLMVDEEHNFGLYHFLEIPNLPEGFEKKEAEQTGPRPILLHDNIDTILARTSEDSFNSSKINDRALDV